MTPEPRLEPTPSQSIGPFFHFAQRVLADNDQHLDEKGEVSE
jgi:hypothetical protein